MNVSSDSPAQRSDAAAPAVATAIAPLPSRREVVQRLAQAACVLPAWSALAACTAAGAPASSAAQGGRALAAKSSAPAGPWASGGTARIGAAARAVNPFAIEGASMCTLTCEATVGPCHTLSPERRDISDGWDGLPLLMQLRVLDVQCRPVVGAIVEVWHTNHTGGYSGRIADMCNNNAQDLDKQFFRGRQRTDSQGVVRFESCYPGWYRGRANHVHLRVQQGDYQADDNATAWLTSQLLFTDALNSAIFQNEPLYRDKGLPDTTLDTDGVVGEEADKSRYVFDVQNLGGVMLASKTLVIRSSLSDTLCMAQGKMPPGPPPGGFPPGMGAGRPPRLPGGGAGPAPGSS